MATEPNDLFSAVKNFLLEGLENLEVGPDRLKRIGEQLDGWAEDVRRKAKEHEAETEDKKADRGE